MSDKEDGSKKLNRLGARLFVIWLLPLAALACATLSRSVTPGAPLSQVTPATEPTLEAAVAGATATDALQHSPTAPPATVTPHESPGAEAASESPEEAATATKTPEAPGQPTLLEILANAQAPKRDDMELARLYQGWDGVLEAVHIAEQPLPLGAVQELNILNLDRNELDMVEFQLLAIGEHAYFWFETSPGSVRPSEDELSRTKEAFDQIYERGVAIFGPEDNPGVDGDPRLHVVNAAPATICDLSGPGDPCGIAGYFASTDAMPAEVDSASNAREMFVMNASNFGSYSYLAVLAHEFRHLIEDNYDQGDTDWEVEGSAVLAAELAGFAGTGVSRANAFLRNPDQQLNRWTDGDRQPYYGQGYLLNRYIYDRFGADFYGQFAASPGTGLAALDEVARANGLAVTGEEIWLDWLVALAIHNEPKAHSDYVFQVQELDTVSMMPVDALPARFDQHVQQFGADYYLLTGEGEATLEFIGRDTVPLFNAEPASGEFMWLANRANYGHMRLTRDVDLSGVDSATLNYNVYHDIEQGYDFAYVFVSEDEGQSWQSLISSGMQGETAEDDPSGSALAPRFYTGTSDGWRAESIDLTPYIGKRIQIRFAYVTDPILTEGGIAIDDIAIPEVGIYDGAETADGGWTAEGFERVTAHIPQPWRLQLVTYADGVPRVERILDGVDHSVSRRVSLDESEGRAILVVAAAAPMTLQPARYSLTISG